MAKSVIFATGNTKKFEEAQLSCDLSGVRLIQKKLDLTEIQSQSGEMISRHKALEAFDLLHEPVVVADTYWSIPALNGFPGAYMKEVTEWFSSQDFINLMQDKDDRTIVKTEYITFYDGNSFEIFSESYRGIITFKPRGNNLSIANVAEFGGETISELYERGEFIVKPQDHIWYKFAEWYSLKIAD